MKADPHLHDIHSNKSSDQVTHWHQVTHICVIKLNTIDSDNGCHLVGTKPLSEPMLEYC